MPDYEIEVSRADVEQFLSRFLVRVIDGEARHSYVVTMSGSDFERLGKGFHSPETFVHASFQYLLEKGSLDQIMGSFDVGQIQQRLPDYPRDIAGRAGDSNA